MFSTADANQLRQSLTNMVFLHDGTESQLGVGANASGLYSAYAQYYGLNFSELDPALRDSRANIGTFTSGHYELVCQHFVPATYPPRKTAFILHGYFDHSGLYRHLIRHLLLQDIAVVIFDLPGHGLSSGETASINSFQEYSESFVRCLKLAGQQKLADPWLAIGQSTGSALIIEALLAERLQHSHALQDTILLAPLLRPRHWSRSRILFSLSKLFLASTPRKFSKNSHDVEFLEFLESKDEMQSRLLPRNWVQAMIDYINRFEEALSQDTPLHVIQGKGDGTVEWETNIPKILEKFLGSQIHWIEEAGHHLVNESTCYRERVFELIDEIIGSD